MVYANLQEASFFPVVDWARRAQGRALDALGLGPQTTAGRTVLSRREVQLLAYQPARAGAAAVLLVPAPIKAAYIWDLAPGSSVVERCVQAGVQVYLAAWRRPMDADANMGLSEYAERALGACAEAISAETGEGGIFFAGHSLGGTLAAIFASLCPRRVRGLIALEAPVAFGAGSIEAALSHAPRSQTAALRPCGNVPGTFLDLASACADPLTFHAEPWLDWLHSLPAPSSQRLHWRVRRWTLDESPMARRLFEEVEQSLYRENRFAQNRLQIDGRTASSRAIVAPVLAILDPRSRLVPAASIEAYRTHTGSADVQTMTYHGDVGVVIQHVGVLVGPSAHACIWPQITRWIQSRAER